MFKVSCPGLLDTASKIGLIPNELATSADPRIKAFAVQCRDYLRKGVKTRTFSYPDLVESYRMRREHPGRPPLFNTGGYLQGVDVVQDPQGFRLGPRPRDALRAAKLEYGDSRTAARPHWRPTMLYAEAHMHEAGEAVVKNLSFRGR